MLKPIFSIRSRFLSNFPSLQRREMRIRENSLLFYRLDSLLDSPRLSGERESKKKKKLPLYFLKRDYLGKLLTQVFYTC